MPYVNKPRPYKKEWEQQQARDEKKSRATRERARYHMDKNGTDNNGNGKADKREGKDIDHVKMLARGGSNKDGIRIVTPAKNRARNGHSPREKGGKKP